MPRGFIGIASGLAIRAPNNKIIKRQRGRIAPAPLLLLGVRLANRDLQVFQRFAQVVHAQRPRLRAALGHGQLAAVLNDGQQVSHERRVRQLSRTGRSLRRAFALRLVTSSGQRRASSGQRRVRDRLAFLANGQRSIASFRALLAGLDDTAQRFERGSVRGV